jgi:hypothetical protein
MTFYSLVLFVHVTAVLALFAALAFEVLALFHLRRSSTLSEVRLWLDPVPRLPLAAMGSLLVVFFSGIYLTIRMSAFGEAWPKVTIAALLFVAPIAVITGRRMRAIRRRCAPATAIDSELQGRLQDPVLKASIGIRIAVILGIVLLMGAKPELWESVGIVGASLVLGLLSSLLASRRTASLSVPSADLGD